MRRLYVLSGSTASSDAEELLSSTGVPFETIDVSDRVSLAAIYRDLSIRLLPAFQSEAILIEGINGIRDYVEGRGWQGSGPD